MVEDLHRTWRSLGWPIPVTRCRLRHKEQKAEWYLSINPNGRSHRLVDPPTTISSIRFRRIPSTCGGRKNRPALSRGESKGRLARSFKLMCQSEGIGPTDGAGERYSSVMRRRRFRAIDRLPRPEARRLMFEVLERQWPAMNTVPDNGIQFARHRALVMGPRIATTVQA